MMHGEAKYQCEYCGCRFRWQNVLISHRKNKVCLKESYRHKGETAYVSKAKGRVKSTCKKGQGNGYG